MTAPISFREIFFGEKAFAAWTISAATAISGANFALMLTIAPTVTRQFGTVHLISWLTTAYLVPAIISGVVTGAIARQLGLRRLMRWTVSVLMAGFGLAIIAPNFETLLFARFLQGIGAGWGAALSYLLIRRHFTGADTARGFVVEAIVYAVGAAGGPLLAGWLIEVSSWRTVFGVDLVLTIGMWILGHKLLNAPDAPRPETPDQEGTRLSRENSRTIALICIGVILLVAAGTDQPWPIGVALFLASIGCGMLAVRHDRRTSAAIFPRELVSLRTVAGIGIILTFLLGALTTPLSIFVPLLAEELFQLRPAFAGIMATLLALAWSFSAMTSSSIRVPRSVDRALIGAPILHVFGALLFIASLTAGSAIMMGAALLILGTGYGLSWAFLQERTIKAAINEQADLTAALLPSAFTLGEVFGALQAGIFARLTGLDNSAAAHTLIQIGGLAAQNTALLAAIGIVLMWLMIGRSRRHFV